MDLTTFNSDVATMSSREIAELCEKRHDNVVVDVEKLFDFYKETYTPEKSGQLIQESSYVASNGKSNKQYLLNKDAALDLITGYSLPHRHAVNQRWQELEAAQPKAFPTDYISALEAFVESQKEKARLELENSKLNTLIDNEFGYCSILRAACFLEVHETTFNWRVLKSHTNLLGLTIKRVPSPRFGYRNLYPLRAFRECYPQFDFDDLTPEKIDDKTSLALTQAAKAINAAK